MQSRTTGKFHERKITVRRFLALIGYTTSAQSVNADANKFQSKAGNRRARFQPCRQLVRGSRAGSYFFAGVGDYPEESFFHEPSPITLADR